MPQKKGAFAEVGKGGEYVQNIAAFPVRAAVLDRVGH